MSQSEVRAVEEGEDVRGMSLADLVVAIGMQNQDPRQADEALAELHCRWGKRIDELCKRMTATFPGKFVGWQPLAGEVWDWLWDSAETFDPAGATGDALEARFYGWIQSAARCRMIDLVRRHHRTALAELPSDASIAAEAEQEEDDQGDGSVRTRRPKIVGIFSPPASGSPEAAAEAARFACSPVETREAIECLRALSPKDQSVLQASAPYLKPGERQVDIPRDEHEAILKLFSTTTDGMRALRSRAFKKVTTCMDTKARKRGGGA